ncbi:unnamed protein product, partial [Rangifer tarandus platyrhynchus]
MHFPLQFTPLRQWRAAVGTAVSFSLCRRSHSRAGFDMPATVAGVFEETDSGDGYFLQNLREVNISISVSLAAFCCTWLIIQNPVLYVTNV